MTADPAVAVALASQLIIVALAVIVVLQRLEIRRRDALVRENRRLDDLVRYQRDKAMDLVVDYARQGLDLEIALEQLEGAAGEIRRHERRAS